MQTDYYYMVPAEYVKKHGTYTKDGIIVRHVDGAFYSYSKQCPHMPEKGDLELGEFNKEEMTIQCCEHNLKFCVLSGVCPVAAIGRKYGNLKIYDVLSEDGMLFIRDKEDETKVSPKKTDTDKQDNPA